ITPQTLSQLIYAQNFSMPIGYIDDEEDNSWLLRVGDEFGSAEDIASSLLMDNDIIGTIRLEDIADITVIDNADDSYTKLNGSDGIILCIYKSSSAGTNDVSKLCNKAFDTLAEDNPGMHTINLVDQGVYISMIVESVFQSIIIGALLAIIILAIFLRDVKPTIVVAISIPLSVLLAIVLMYFTGLELNMMTLSGLSLGIGMLVDNSVVVMENIFRLRGRGLPAPRAAVQGAKQVRGSIIASTLTTICVFFPAVFATGTVKSLLYPLALSVGYCLVASLVIAMSVVPASCSTIMKNTTPKEHKLFDKVLGVYGKSLSWCLRFKVVPLIIAVSLLTFSVYEVLQMGIVYIPEITTNELNITIVTPEEMTREESYLKVDEIMDDILSVQGINDIGIMDSGSTTSFLMAGLSDDSYGTYVCYALADEGASAEKMAQISSDIESATSDSGCKITVETDSMGSMSSMMGSSGVSVLIYGNNYDELERISGDVREILEGQEGLTKVRDSFGEGDPTLQVIVDRDAAMRYGLTVAQIYAGIAGHTSTSVTATTVTIDGTEMKVNIVDNTVTITKEDLMDLEFEEVDMTGGADTADYSDMASAFEDMTEDDETDEAEEEAAEEEEEEEESKIHTLSEFAEVIETTSSSSISRENLTRYVTVSASVEDGYNATLISRELGPKLDDYNETLDRGYSVEISGESTEVMEMVVQMLEMAALALLFIYLIMVAQFQSLLSPLIILFTIPLAFTGGLIGLLITGIPLSMLSLLGFVVLMGTVVNNGIVFVDYVNRLRIGGLERREALVATGITRMRPILMTALTTILAMSMMIFGSGMASQLGRGMAVVIAAGLLYATFMTLYIVPVMYDILFKKQPLDVDVGSDIDEAINDAADYLQSHAKA
ncbi:MAG: efflux RND transporter permease subunit, partial [Clostridiales bacterium]|nr:efflux RND transporter permease subunit [Clostridiales bacterium]